MLKWSILAIHLDLLMVMNLAWMEAYYEDLILVKCMALLLQLMMEPKLGSSYDSFNVSNDGKLVGVLLGDSLG